MKKTEICEMCECYCAGEQCDNESRCKMMALYNENVKLKAEVNDLKKDLSQARLKMSYMINSMAIGERNDMGW